MAEEKRVRSKPPSGLDENRQRDAITDPLQTATGRRVKFIIFGEEMIEKRVNASGNSGRVYLPLDWVGHKVTITRID